MKYNRYRRITKKEFYMTETQGISGKVFKYLREKRGLSLKEAAADTVTPQFLGRFEKGQSSLSIDNF
ncbi:helix-turn-helix domain-containing protein, partial [Streptococcus sp. SGI.013]|uniref:helix-turn-helix domain-containing protein n=1 Tax=unclassified Streptococcus TaxID=2608887 RepID=UPI003CFC42BD